MNCFDFCFPVCETGAGWSIGLFFWLFLLMGALIVLVILVMMIRVGKYRITKGGNESWIFQKVIEDVEGMPVEEWGKKYANFYNWLLENGFEYNPKKDKHKKPLLSKVKK